jgi:hypothetical protein
VNTKLRILILKSLLACDGQPMPEVALISAVQMLARPLTPTDGDVIVALGAVQRERFAEGVTDDFTKERSWTLTVSGVHQARKL